MSENTSSGLFQKPSARPWTSETQAPAAIDKPNPNGSE